MGYWFNLGFADFGLAQAIAIVVILAVMAVVLEVWPSLTVGYVTGALLMVPLAIFIVFLSLPGTGIVEPRSANAGGFSVLGGSCRRRSCLIARPDPSR